MSNYVITQHKLMKVSPPTDDDHLIFKIREEYIIFGDALPV